MLWTMGPGHVFRTGSTATDVTVLIDGFGSLFNVPAGSFVMSLGEGGFVLMETGETFATDALDALILGMDSEELMSRG